jgi:hypothetical protein
MLWTESYLLQAFLACNDEFAILCAGRYLATHYPETGESFFPSDPKLCSTGSFWMRRVADNTVLG